MSSAASILVIPLSLTEGGRCQAECDTVAKAPQECALIAKEHEDSLREEISLAKKEKGSCLFNGIKLRCQREASRYSPF